MIRLYGASIALVLLAMTPVLAQRSEPSPRQPKQPASQAQAETDKRGSPENPLSVRLISPPKTEQEAADDKAARQEQVTADWWLVRLTAALAVIGLIQSIVFWVQAQRLRQTIIKMDEIATGQNADMQASIAEAARAARAMEELLKPMAVAANAARLSADVAEQTLRLTERADIAWFDVAFRPEGRVTQDTIVILSFRNSGRTRADNVSAIGWFGDLNAPKPPVQIEPNQSVGAGHAFNLGFRPVKYWITPGGFSEILKSGRLGFWMYLTYQDIFGSPHSLLVMFAWHKDIRAFRVVSQAVDAPLPGDIQLAEMAARHEPARMVFGNWTFPTLEPGVHVRMQVDFTNVGRAPAKIIEGSFRCAIGSEDALPDPPAYKDPDKFGIYVEAGGTFHHYLKVRNTAEEIARLQLPDVKFFIWGYLRYEDPSGKERTLRYGRWYNARDPLYGTILRNGYEDPG